MQSSIWKIVTAVGIIGVGTLVVLEVQNQLSGKLPPSESASAMTSGDPSETLGDSTVTPESDTEFDRLFGGTGDPGFNLNEPASTGQPESGARIAATSGGSVDTEVRRDALVDEENLFASSAPPSNSVSSSSRTFTSRGLETPPAADIDSADSGTATRDIRTASYAQQETFSPDQPAERPTPAGGGNSLPVFDGFDANGGATGIPSDRGTSLPGSSGGSPVPTPQNDPIFDDNPFPGDGIGNPGETETPAGRTPTLTLPTDSAVGGALPAAEEPEIEFFSGDDAVPAPRMPSGSGSQPAAEIGGAPELRFDEPFIPDNSGPAAPVDPRIPEPTGSGIPDPVRTPGSSGRPTAPTVNRPQSTPQGNTFADESDAARRGNAGGIPFSEDPADTPRVTAPPAGTPGGRGTSDPDFFAPDPDFPTTPALSGQPLETDVPDLNQPGGSVLPAIDEGGPRPVGTEFPELPTGPPAGRPGTDRGLPGLPGSPQPGIGAPGTSGRPLNPAGPSGGPVTIDDGTSVSQLLQPHLTIQKNAPQTATVGVPLEYTIVVRNEGDSAASEVMIDDELSPGADLVTADPVPRYDRQTRKMQWILPNLAAGESETIRVRITPTGEGTLNGVATVRFKAEVSATTVITAPRLSLRMTTPSEVRVGDEVQLHFVIRNDGSGDASNVILRSVLPPGLNHPEGRDLEYEVASLRSNEQREVTLTVAAAEAGDFSCTAEVASSGQAAAQSESEIRIIGAQLKIERLGPDHRYVGRASRYQNVVTNDTRFEATGVVVKERVPEQMKFVDATSGGRYNPADRLVTWNVDRIDAGKQALLEIQLEPEEPGQADSVVEVIEQAGFRSRATQAVTIEGIHNLSADISRLNGPVQVGEKFGFTITVENRGTSPATNVTLSIDVPPEIKVTAAGTRTMPGSLYNGNIVRYQQVTSIAPGDTQVFRVEMSGQEPVRNAFVKAKLRYAEMEETMVVAESVTVFTESE